MKQVKLLFLLSLISVLGLSGCKNKDNNPSDGEPNNQQSNGDETPGDGEDSTPEYEKGEKKEVKGTGLVFSESVGFNTKDATIFAEDNNNAYVIYASNETAKGKQVFAARKATLENGEWKVGEKHIVLRPKEGEDDWDKAIYQPSVIKGKFNKGGTEYHYLMAYQGNDGTTYNNHIGLAVTNDVLGEWTRVGEDPLIENPELFESSFGFGSPELLSYDQQGKAYLFYSFGETTLSGTRVKTADFSDLDHISLEAGYAELPVEGLLGRDDNITSNGSFALGNDGKLYYAGDGMPDSNAPGCATSFEIAKANLTITQSASEEWTSIARVNSLDTMDGDMLGWDELYSPTFLRDGYGRIDVSGPKLQICYSTYNVGVMDSAYTAQLCLHEVTL